MHYKLLLLAREKLLPALLSRAEMPAAPAPSTQGAGGYTHVLLCYLSPNCRHLLMSGPSAPSMMQIAGLLAKAYPAVSGTLNKNCMH